MLIFVVQHSDAVIHTDTLFLNIVSYHVLLQEFEHSCWCYTVGTCFKKSNLNVIFTSTDYEAEFPNYNCLNLLSL